jgi:hypothetical protein
MENRYPPRFPGLVGLGPLSFRVALGRELAVKKNFSARPPGGCLAVCNYYEIAPHQ